MNHNVSQQYLRQVNQFLICDRKNRRRLLERCKDLVKVFQEENPDAEYADIVAAFGEPSTCAAELLSGLNTSSVKDARKILFINRSIFVIIIIAFTLVSSFFFYKYLKIREFDEDSILIIEAPVRITEEEFDANKPKADLKNVSR